MQEVARQTQVAIIYLTNNAQITSQFYYYYTRMNVTTNKQRNSVHPCKMQNTMKTIE